jgi:hypothetical protein
MENRGREEKKMKRRILRLSVVQTGKLLGGILMAAVYNRSAKWVGGLEVTVETAVE